MSSKIDSYLANVRNKNVRTAKVFGSHLRDFDKYLDGMTDKIIEDLRAGARDYFELMNGYVAFLKNKHTLSNKYIGYSVKTARRFLSYYDVEITDSKFRQKILLPKAEKRRPSPLEKSDVIKIINECKEPRLKIYIHFLAATGCRAEEALSLRLGDLNLEKGMAHLHAEFTKIQMDRDVRLTTEICREITSWLEYKYRPRTIKSYDEAGKLIKRDSKLIKRDIKPSRHSLDFVFLPYNESDRLMTDIDKVRQHTKNAYLMHYKTFRPTMDRIAYDKVTFHTFRRHFYSTLSSLVDANYAEYAIGHEASEYWGKTPKVLEEIFRKVEMYITYLDVESLEAKQKDIVSEVEGLKEQNERLRAEIRVINNNRELIESKTIGEIERLKRSLRYYEGKPEPEKMTDKEFEIFINNFNMKEFGTSDPQLIREAYERIRVKLIQEELVKMRSEQV